MPAPFTAECWPRLLNSGFFKFRAAGLAGAYVSYRNGQRPRERQFIVAAAIALFT
jgi:hypothetical protein